MLFNESATNRLDRVGSLMRSRPQQSLIHHTNYCQDHVWPFLISEDGCAFHLRNDRRFSHTSFAVLPIQIRWVSEGTT